MAMTARKSFTAAKGADFLVPRRFGETLMTLVQANNRAEREFNTQFHALDTLDTEAKTRNDDALREKTVEAYLKFIDEAENVVLFLGFCMKNRHVIPAATPWIAEDVFRLVDYDYPLHDLSDIHALERKMGRVTERIFQGSELVATIMDGDITGNVSPLSSAIPGPSRAEIQNFHDWIERRFLDVFDLPLNLFPRSSELEKEFESYLSSAYYCENLMQNIHNRSLQERFPGLTLDGAPPKASQSRQQLYQLIAAHVRSFTPSKIAHVIHLGAVTQAPKGPGASARRSLRHS